MKNKEEIKIEKTTESKKAYKHIEIVAGAFVGILLISNIASTKIFGFGLPTFTLNLFGLEIVIDLVLDGGTILFPLSYIFGDVLTEVYGFANTRKVIWLGFIMAAVMSLVLFIVGMLPPADMWNVSPHHNFLLQDAYNSILGQTPMIVIGSLVAYFFGSYSNSMIMSIMKKKQKGRHLWKRTIGSTLVGEGIDTIIFVLIAFGIPGILPLGSLIGLIILNYIFKVLVEVFMTPVTYKIVNTLKTKIGKDVYDENISYTPI
jgi:queuosine precursor transporter